MYHENSLSPPVTNIHTVTLRCFLCGFILLFLFRVYHAVLSVHCNLMALLYVMFSCVFVSYILCWFATRL